MAMLLLLSRFLGAKDMGSNFYPFTAARKGNKLVTKGLFSKLTACLTTSACDQLDSSLQSHFMSNCIDVMHLLDSSFWQSGT